MADDLRNAIRRNTLAALVNALALAAPGVASAEIVASQQQVATLTDRYWNEGSSQSVLVRLYDEEARLENLVCTLCEEMI